MNENINDTEFRPQARAPRGFADKRGRDIAIERKLIAKVSGVYESFGFEPLETSGFEYADALGKFLPDADRPNVGVFSMQDDDDQWMALRYDLTAPLARFAAQNWETLPKPYRRYAYGPVWRNEKPGPGRFREFIQCDADSLGSDRPQADAEMIAMAVAGFSAMEVPCLIKINNRKLLNGLLGSLGLADPKQQLGVLRAIDKLDRLGMAGVEALLGGGRKDVSGDFTKGAELSDQAIAAVLSFVGAGGSDRDQVLDRLGQVLANAPEGQAGLLEISSICEALKHLGVTEAQAVIEPSIVRGLEYYTGPVFEAELLLDTLDEAGNQVKFGSVGGGGRYDDLVARFTGQSVPATGFSFGVTRLAQVIAASPRFADKLRGPIVIIAFKDEHMAQYFALASEIRAAGMKAEVYLGRSGMKAQMKYADRRGSLAAVMLGEDELASGKVTIKDLDQGRFLSLAIIDHQEWREGRPGQVTLDRAQAIDYLRKISGTL
jgi:histidyl-tRNA synthetase